MSAAMKASRIAECDRAARRAWRAAVAMSSALALAAASRTMPRSKKMRALLRFSSESRDEDSMILAATSSWRDHRVRGELQHLGALAMRDRHQPDACQRLHRLADRRTADLEALHQFALRRHLVAGLQFAAGDHRFSRAKTSSDSLRRTIGSDGFIMADHRCSQARSSYHALIAPMRTALTPTSDTSACAHSNTHYTS